MSETRELIARTISGAPFASVRSLAKADAVLAALSQAGLVIVPKEPTDAMRVAGFDNNEVHSYFHGAEPAWRAMIDAAGKP